MKHVSKLNGVTTASKEKEVEREYGVRYSELLRLPYLDIIQHHVIDPMQNLLLGTGKYMLTLWKTQGLLSKADFESIQDMVDSVKVPCGVGRIPHKLGSNAAGFTVDQWRNWICVYSLYSLKQYLPDNHYEC